MNPVPPGTGLQVVSKKVTPPLKLFGTSALCETLQICWQFISTYIYQFLLIYFNISPNGFNFAE